MTGGEKTVIVTQAMIIKAHGKQQSRLGSTQFFKSTETVLLFQTPKTTEFLLVFVTKRLAYFQDKNE